MNPTDRVQDAMPGTLAELVERTGYPRETVLKMITNLRREGVRVNAREDGVTRNVPPRVQPDPEWTGTTVYEEGPYSQ